MSKAAIVKKEKRGKGVAEVLAEKGILIPEPMKVRLSDLNFATYNPRYMPPGHMRSLKASLLKYGLVLNLVVQKKGSVLIGGHQRVTAVREICAEKGWAVPEFAWAVVLDVDDDTAKQLNVALNSEGLSGEFDAHKLGVLFAEVYPRMQPTDLSAVGFEASNVEELIRLALPPDDLAARLEDDAAGLADFARSVTLTLEFDTVENRDKAKALLAERAKETRRKPGNIVLEAVRAQFAVKRGRRVA